MTCLCQIFIAIIAFIGGFTLFSSNWRRAIRIFCRTFPRDILGAYRFFKMKFYMQYLEFQNMNVARLFTKLVDSHPDKVAYICEDQEWTYQQLDEFSNRIARYFRDINLKRGDSVALFMESRIEYVGIWLGLIKAGYVAALINSNLRHDVLVHSIKAAECKVIIFSAELQSAFNDIKDKILDVKSYQWSDNSKAGTLENSVDLGQALKSVDPSRLLKELALGSSEDKLVYIYTSGTTGAPKAAVINNRRFMLMACGLYYMLGFKRTDRIYDSLPLYHTAGGVLGAGQALLCDVTVVLRKRFSASNFISDCIRYECTVAQYIGEICRYILAVPPSPSDKGHKLRLMYGNGLRPQIWKSFVERFQVKQIGEIYGATEGISNLVNIDNTVGAIGFVPRLGRSVYNVALLKVDEDNPSDPLRGPDGLCIPCKPGEPGVFVGKIDPKQVFSEFRGYSDQKASQKKVIHNVLQKGDKFFNSGDILVMDEYSYFYFKDRTGDTFRWKGENVSTSEVEAVISNIVGLKDVIVYGVEVPHLEGKAGMAAIYDPEQRVNLDNLAVCTRKALPVYARPLFVRQLSELPMTGTFKLKKKTLQDEAFDIHKVTDRLYILDRTDKYIPITENVYNDILQQKIRL